MRFPIETHTFLWFVFGDKQLSARAKRLIEDPNNEIESSLASIWEMTIKHSLGKLPLDRPIKDFIEAEIEANDIKIATILPAHIFELVELPQNHKDPFDRLIAAQARVEGVQLVSFDTQFDNLSVTRTW